MHPMIIALIILAVVYVVGLLWIHHYWSKYMNRNRINLSPGEAQAIVSMLFMWFFFWDGIEVIMRHADRYPDEETE